MVISDVCLSRCLSFSDGVLVVMGMSPKRAVDQVSRDALVEAKNFSGPVPLGDEQVVSQMGHRRTPRGRAAEGSL